MGFETSSLTSTRPTSLSSVSASISRNVQRLQKKIKLQHVPSPSVKIITVGSRSFVTSFQLAGVSGVISETAEDAFREIDALTDDKDVGLVLVSDDVSNPISDKLTKLRTVKSAIVFSLPAVGSSKSTIDYRSMLKKILGV